MSYTLGIYTLGCKVNQYESEAIAEKASKMGAFHITSKQFQLLQEQSES